MLNQRRKLALLVYAVVACILSIFPDQDQIFAAALTISLPHLTAWAAIWSSRLIFIFVILLVCEGTHRYKIRLLCWLL